MIYQADVRRVEPQKARALVQYSALKEEQEQQTESSAALGDKSGVERTPVALS